MPQKSAAVCGTDLLLLVYCDQLRRRLRSVLVNFMLFDIGSLGIRAEESPLPGQNRNIDIFPLRNLPQDLREGVVMVLCHSIELLLIIDSDNGDPATVFHGNDLRHGCYMSIICWVEEVGL